MIRHVSRAYFLSVAATLPPNHLLGHRPVPDRPRGHVDGGDRPSRSRRLDGGGGHEVAGQLQGPAEDVVADSLANHDATHGSDVVSDGPITKKSKTLDVVGRGIRTTWV